MLLYHCTLTLHDSLFYETRSVGRFYETGQLLHNIALCYALGFASTSYFHPLEVPQYGQELANLNSAGIYVTPARGLEPRFVTHTFKLGDERTLTKTERSNANIPNYGRAKELEIGNQFVFGILSEASLTLPRWIRLGLWLSKAHLVASTPISLTWTEPEAESERSRTISVYPLNPNDLPDSATLRLFDLVSMRPTSLVENALIECPRWWSAELPDGQAVYLPIGLQHRADFARR